MTFLFFDTETTGLPSHYTDHTRPDCPYIVELGAILTDDHNQELGRMCHVVNVGEPVPKEASDLHGITTERVCSEGIPLLHALLLFERLLVSAPTVVSHNHIFDRLMIKAAYYRLGIPHPLSPLDRFCTMRAAQKLLGGRLTDLETYYLRLFGVPFAGAHGALADTEACRRIFFHLRSLPAKPKPMFWDEPPSYCPPPPPPPYAPAP